MPIGEKYSPKIILALMALFFAIACADDDNSGPDHEFTADDCRAVRDNCQAIAESVC